MDILTEAKTALSKIDPNKEWPSEYEAVFILGFQAASLSVPPRLIDDAFELFCEECLTVRKGARTHTDSIYGAYLKWCEDNDTTPRGSLPIQLLRICKGVIHKKALRIDGVNRSGYINLALK